MKRVFLLLLAALLCAGTAFAEGIAYTGEKYTTQRGYALTVFWPEGDRPEQALLDDIQDVYFAAYPAMRETFGTTDAQEVTLYICDESAMPENTPALTSGNSIRCSREFLTQERSNLNCIVHELFHVVQNTYPGAQENPEIAVLTEGLADYARGRYGVLEETNWSLPAYAPGQSFSDSYRVTAAFLKWAEHTVSGDLCLRLNRVLHEGRYSEAFWTEIAGCTLEALWAQYAQQGGAE